MNSLTRRLWIADGPRQDVLGSDTRARHDTRGLGPYPGTKRRPVPLHRFFEIKTKLLDCAELWTTAVTRPAPLRDSPSSDAPAQKHRRTRPAASSFGKAWATVPAAPTPYPCSDAPRVA